MQKPKHSPSNKFMKNNTKILFLNRFEERIQKLNADIETAHRIHEKHQDPLEILDKLLNGMFELAREGLQKQFPTYSPIQINNLLKEQALIFKKNNRRNEIGRIY